MFLPRFTSLKASVLIELQFLIGRKFTNSSLGISPLQRVFLFPNHAHIITGYPSVSMVP